MKMCVHSITAFVTAVASGAVPCHPAPRCGGPISLPFIISSLFTLMFVSFTFFLSASASSQFLVGQKLIAEWKKAF